MAESKTKNTGCVETVYLQFGGKEASLEAIRDAISTDYNSVKEGKDAPNDIKIYLKPEDNKAYYVINNDYAGEILLPLE